MQNKGGIFIQYQGSKARFAKYIVPIIQRYINENDIHTYLEPFSGGCNIIDKISCETKIAYDKHYYLIELLKHVQYTTDDLPDTILYDEYQDVKNNKECFDSWFVGLVGFCASFGNKWFGGYARNSSEDTNGARVAQSINNLKKQAPSLKDIHFKCMDFRDIDTRISGAVIYNDIPYKNTTSYKTGSFPYEEFYDWCKEMSKNNIVLVSEYDMPGGFKCIWEKETKVLLDRNKSSNDENNKRIEKLFICEG